MPSPAPETGTPREDDSQYLLRQLRILQQVRDPTAPCVTIPFHHEQIRREIASLFLSWLHDNDFLSTIRTFRDEMQSKHRSEHLAQKLLLQLARAIEEGNWDLAHQLAKKAEVAMNANITHHQEERNELLKKAQTPTNIASMGGGGGNAGRPMSAGLIRSGGGILQQGGGGGIAGSTNSGSGNSSFSGTDALRSTLGDVSPSNGIAQAQAFLNNNSNTNSGTPNSVLPQQQQGTLEKLTPTHSGGSVVPIVATNNNPTTNPSVGVNNTSTQGANVAAPPSAAAPTATTAASAGAFATGTVTWLLSQQQFLELVDEGDSSRAFSFFMRRLKPFESLVGVERFQMLAYLLTVKSVSEAAPRYPEESLQGWTPLSGRADLVRRLGHMLDASLNSPNAVSVMAGRWFRQRGDTLDNSLHCAVSTTSPPALSLQTIFEQALSYQYLSLLGGGSNGSNGMAADRNHTAIFSPSSSETTSSGVPPVSPVCSSSQSAPTPCSVVPEVTSILKPLVSQQPPSSVKVRVTASSPLRAVEPFLELGGIVIGTGSGEVRWGLIQNDGNADGWTLNETLLTQHGSAVRALCGASSPSVTTGAIGTRPSLLGSAVAMVASCGGTTVALSTIPNSKNSSSTAVVFTVLQCNGEVHCICFSPCHQFVVYGTSAGDVVLCEVVIQHESTPMELSLSALPAPTSSPAPSKHSNNNNSSGLSNTTRVISLRPVDTYHRRPNAVRHALQLGAAAAATTASTSTYMQGSLSNSVAATAVQFNTTGTTLYASYLDGFVQAFNMITGTCTLELAPPVPSPAIGLTLGAAQAPFFSNFLFVSYRGNGLRAFDICTGSLTSLRLEGPRATTARGTSPTVVSTAGANDPGHMFVITGTDDGALLVWSLRHPEHFAQCAASGCESGSKAVQPMLRQPNVHKGAITDLKIKEHYLVSCGADGTVCICGHPN